MNGILSINKPQGFTSFDVVAKLRGITGIKKIGHSGTLDPLATGVLPVFFGKATRAIDLLPDSSKRYAAGFRLGETTDTLDITGTLINIHASDVIQEQIEQVLPQFCGTITQIPPMYSAVKLRGKRLYELARQGKQVDREHRQVEIHQLELLSFNREKQEGVLDVKCSKGTYIRTIIDDLGAALGTGGVMTELTRTQSGCFSYDDCVTLEQVKQWKENGELENKLLPIDYVFKEIPEIHLDQSQSLKFLNGIRLDLNRIMYNNKSIRHRVYNDLGQFLGIADTNLGKNELIVKKMFFC